MPALKTNDFTSSISKSNDANNKTLNTNLSDIELNKKLSETDTERAFKEGLANNSNTEINSPQQQ